MAAACEDLYRIRFLEISTPDFGARNLRRNGQNGDAAALAIVEAIDQVHVSRPAASGAYRQLAGEMRFGAGRERGCLLMAHTNPFDVLAGTNRIRDAIERIARHSVNSLNIRFHQDVDQQVSHSLCPCHSFPAIWFPELQRQKRGTNYATGAVTFSNPSAFSDRRRHMPGMPACLFHNGRAPGRKVLRLYRPAA